MNDKRKKVNTAFGQSSRPILIIKKQISMNNYNNPLIGTVSLDRGISKQRLNKRTLLTKI